MCIRSSHGIIKEESEEFIKESGVSMDTEHKQYMIATYDRICYRERDKQAVY